MARVVARPAVAVMGAIMDEKLNAAAHELASLGLEPEAWFLRGWWDAATGLPVSGGVPAEREHELPRGERMGAHRERAQLRRCYELGVAAFADFDIRDNRGKR